MIKSPNDQNGRSGGRQRFGHLSVDTEEQAIRMMPEEHDEQAFNWERSCCDG
jgi:hypothetical protein